MPGIIPEEDLLQTRTYLRRLLQPLQGPGGPLPLQVRVRPEMMLKCLTHPGSSLITLQLAKTNVLSSQKTLPHDVI